MTPLVHGLALLVTFCAAISDARTGLIPNWITLPAIALAPILFGVIGGSAALGTSVLGLVACGLVPYLLFRLGAGGGGDVKLLAAIGAIAGAKQGLEIECFAFFLAATGTVIVFAWQGRLWKLLRNSAVIAVGWALPRRWRRPVDVRAMTSVRMGVPIFISTLAVIWCR